MNGSTNNCFQLTFRFITLHSAQFNHLWLRNRQLPLVINTGVQIATNELSQSSCFLVKLGKWEARWMADNKKVYLVKSVNAVLPFPNNVFYSHFQLGNKNGEAYYILGWKRVKSWLTVFYEVREWKVHCDNKTCHSGNNGMDASIFINKKQENNRIEPISESRFISQSRIE